MLHKFFVCFFYTWLFSFSCRVRFYWIFVVAVALQPVEAFLASHSWSKPFDKPVNISSGGGEGGGGSPASISVVKKDKFVKINLDFLQKGKFHHIFHQIFTK